ncbi:hypothetical protein GCM10023405_48470 [Streptomonospora salina]
MAGLALQLAQVLGEAGRCDVQRLRGLRDGAVYGDRVQHAQPLQIEHVSDATERRSPLPPGTPGSPGIAVIL